MQTIYLSKCHKILSQDKNCERNRLESKVVLITEPYQTKNHYNCSLEAGLPNPAHKIYH